MHTISLGFLVQALAEVGDVRLGGGVHGQLGGRLEAGDAAHVEQVARTTRHHRAQRGMAQSGEFPDVERDLAVEPVGVERVERAGGAEPGVVDDEVDPADEATKASAGKFEKDYTKDLKAPLLGIFGNDDKEPDVDQVNKTEEILKSLGKTYEFHRYDKAGHAFFNFTRIGIAMQATSQNQLAAYYMGIPVRRVNNLIWGISAAVAAFAGILLAPVTLIDINMGLAVALKAFAAAVLGGFGSIPGALVGGLTNLIWPESAVAMK